MRRALILLLLATASQAATYHVNASTGNDTNTAVQAQDPATPWATISHCSSVAVANDTCMVHAGSYAGWTQSASGTNGNPITFTTNSGDVVNITSTINVSNTNYIVIGAPAAGGGCAANAATHTFPKAGATAVGGCFTFVNAGIVGGGSGTPTTHFTLTYNSFSGSSPPTALNIPDGFGSGSTDNVIGHNFFNGLSAPTPYCTHSWYIYGDRNRIEYNESEGLGDDFSDLGGANVVFRFNYWHDDDGNRSLGCGQSPTHQDLVQVIGGGTSPTLSFSLIEGNTTQNITNDGGNTHAFSIIRTGNSTPPAADTVIIRYNYANNYDGDAVNVGGVGDNVPNQSTYNNTAATKQSLAIYNSSFLSLQGTIGGAAILNNIIYNVEATAGGPCPCYPISAGSLVENGNLLFTTAYAGSWPSPYSAEGTYTALHNQDPQFANFPTDGTLKATSPAIGAGVPLTTTVGAGSTSTALTVLNCHPFQPGWAGIPADWIRIGASTTVQISGINYSTCVITLASAVSWNNGDPVYLYKTTDATIVLTGAAPTLGAFPVAASLSFAPSSLTFGSQAVGTTSASQSITVTNVGSGAVTGLNSGITIIGANLGDYAQSNNCPASLNANSPCIVNVTFTPTAAGTRNANVQLVFSGGTGSPQLLSLTGTGVSAGPILSCTPTSLSFGTVNINTTSAAQSLACQNTGNANLTITSVALATGTNFAVSTTPAGCAAGCTVAASGTFTISATATPLSVGALTDTINVTSNAPSSVDHFTVSVTGNDPTKVNLLQTVHCGPQSWTGTCTIAASSAGSLLAVGFGGYNSCGTSTTISSLSDNKTSTYAQVSGARSTNTQGTNTSFSDIWAAANVSAGVTTITVTPSATCTGDVEVWEFANVNTVDTAAQLSSQLASATPSGAAVTTAATKEAVVAMLHPTPGSAPSGIHAGNVFTSDSTADGMAFAHYIPTATGTYTPQWDMTSGTFGASTAAFSFSSGTSPAVNLSVSSITFPGIQNIGGSTNSITVTLQNTGNASLTITSIALTTGTSFTIAANTCGASLAVGASCTVTLKFRPVAAGALTDSLVFTTNAASSPDSVSLSGTAQVQPTNFSGVVIRGDH